MSSGNRSADPLISVIVPVFNEEENLEILAARLASVMAAARLRYELILVDDGSTDRSLDIMKALHAGNPHIRYVSFSRNFGHEAASSCGMAAATGDVAVLMDADLQDPPELIPEMLERWREGFDVVGARRRSRGATPTVDTPATG